MIAVRAEGLTKRFGGIDVVDRVSFQVARGEILGLIGPNGAGKTAMLNLLSGVLKPDGGRLFVGEQDATGLPTHRLARMGIVRTFQNSRELDRLSVLENVMLAARDNPGERLGSALVSTKATRAAERTLTDRARGLLELVSLSAFEARPAGTLSGGQKKLLELARSLMAEADTILLDEIAAGVAPHLVEEIITMIRKLNAEFGTTFVIVEHNMGFIRTLSSRVAVMAAGRLLAEGVFEDVARNPEVIESYLGQAA